MNLFDECVSRLASLDRYSPSEVDRITDAYLVSFGPQSASVRIDLAEAFLRRASPSEQAESTYWRIRRLGPERPL